jgi:hypothetical protein
MVGRFGISVKHSDPNYLTYDHEACVEVDAIPSDQIREILDTEIQKHVDLKAWEKSQAKKEHEQQELRDLAAKFQGGQT